MTLSDTHLVLLSAAAQRDDYLLLRPGRVFGKALEKLAARLTSAGLAGQIVVKPDQPQWSTDEAGEAMSTDGLGVVMGLNEISARLTRAAAVARAAVTCAETGAERGALRIALNLDQVLHEATTLHQALILLGRMPRAAIAGEEP